jgi:uncharacterized protein YggE
MRKRLIGIGLAAVVVLSAFFYYVAIPRVSVSGTGTASAIPDQAQISFTVRTRNASAANAVSEGAAIMDRVLAGLAEVGIVKDAITTNGYSLNPIYNQTDSFCKQGYCPTPTTAGIIVGYEVVQSLQVTIADTTSVGRVLDKIVQAGVIQIDWIGFSFKDQLYNSLRAQAYQKAAQDAHGQAQAIVGALGGIIIGVASASTNYWGPIYPEQMRNISGVTPPTVPVVPSGTITVTATVNIVYFYV